MQPLLPVALGLNDRNLVVVSPAANSAGFSCPVKTWNDSFTTSPGSFPASFTLEDHRKVHVSGVLLQRPEVVSSPRP